MRYENNGFFCPKSSSLTLLSLLVNLSAPESVVSSDAFDSDAPRKHITQPTPVPWSLEHFLTSTNAMEAFLVGASRSTTHISSSTSPDQSSNDPPPYQNDTRSWGLNQFVTHSERIDRICLDWHGSAAAKIYTRILLAQIDSILTVFQPVTQLSRREGEQGASYCSLEAR